MNDCPFWLSSASRSSFVSYSATCLVVLNIFWLYCSLYAVASPIDINTLSRKLYSVVNQGKCTLLMVDPQWTIKNTCGYWHQQTPMASPHPFLSHPEHIGSPDLVALLLDGAPLLTHHFPLSPQADGAPPHLPSCPFLTGRFPSHLRRVLFLVFHPYTGGRRVVPFDSQQITTTDRQAQEQCSSIYVNRQRHRGNAVRTGGFWCRSVSLQTKVPIVETERFKLKIANCQDSERREEGVRWLKSREMRSKGRGQRAQPLPASFPSSSPCLEGSSQLQQRTEPDLHSSANTAFLHEPDWLGGSKWEF